MKLILIGFMGSGKTVVANKLSKSLNLTCLEMDELILHISKKKSISDIFKSRFGELEFRKYELEVANNLVHTNNCVISTGGGIVANKNILKDLKLNGTVIYLKTEFKTIKKRLKNSYDRPLFENDEAAFKLYKYRLPYYNNYADLVIETDKKTVAQVTKEIVKNLKYT